MDKFTAFLNNTILSVKSETSSESDEEDFIMPNATNFEVFAEGSSFSEYLERFEAHLLLNKVTSESQKTVHLIGVSGGFLYSKMASACNPRKPVDVPFSELKELLQGALCP